MGKAGFRLFREGGFEAGYFASQDKGSEGWRTGLRVGQFLSDLTLLEPVQHVQFPCQCDGVCIGVVVLLGGASRWCGTVHLH